MFNIPSHVEQVIKTLSKSGYRAYVVGGAVRDLPEIGVKPRL